MPDTGSQEKASRIQKKQNNSPFIHFKFGKQNRRVLDFSGIYSGSPKGQFPPCRFTAKTFAEFRQ
jgi:hypothetical protein